MILIPERTIDKTDGYDSVSQRQITLKGDSFPAIIDTSISFLINEILSNGFVYQPFRDYYENRFLECEVKI